MANCESYFWGEALNGDGDTQREGCVASVECRLVAQHVKIGVVTLDEVEVAPTPSSLIEEIEAVVAACRNGTWEGEPLRDAVRDMLRHGGYKPSGRSKPASEYLAQRAREGQHALINNAVDIINYVSLRKGVPISLLDRAVTTDNLVVRLGLAQESYVFNSAGQSLDLQNLICAACAEPTPGVPFGSPVKDSLAGKITSETKKAICLVYSPSTWSGLDQTLSLLLTLFQQHVCATVTLTTLH